MALGKLSSVDTGDIDNVSSVSDIFKIAGVEYSSATVFTIDTSLGDGAAGMMFNFYDVGAGTEIFINWGDGTEDTYTTEGFKSHTYSTGGVYTVSLLWSDNVHLSGFGFNDEASRNSGPRKITNVTQWGTSAIWNLRYSSNLTNITASGQPNFYQTSAPGGGFFNECRGLINVNGLESWDVNGLSLTSWFVNTLSFNQDISGWDVSSVTDMEALFFGSAFNRDISGWDVSSVTDMRRMFFFNQQFNFSLANWDLSSVTNMTFAFDNANGLSDANVAATLIGWEAAATTASGVDASSCWGNRTMSETTYPAAKTAYDNLVSVKGWNLTNAINWVA